MKTSFYFYFQKEEKDKAEELEKHLLKQGFASDLHLLDYDGGQWSLTVEKNLTNQEELARLDSEFEDYPSKFGGEYDGNEVMVD